MLFLLDLVADLVFLLVQGALFLLGDVPAVLARHAAFLTANLRIFLVDFCGLALRTYT